MRRTCPWCCEPIGVGQRGAARCPACDRPLQDQQGRELRAIDLRYEEVEARLWERFQRMLLVGTPLVALLLFFLPALHVGAVAAAPLLTVIHLVVTRLFLLREPRRLLGTVRRRFVRWLCRLAFFWIGVPGYALAAAPLIGLIPGTVTYVGLTTATWAYAKWSLSEERERAPLARWEKGLLVVLVTLSLVAAAVLALVVAGIGLSVAMLTDWIAAE